MYFIILCDEVEFLIGLLQKEDDIREHDDRHQLDFTSSVIEIGHTFEPTV